LATSSDAPLALAVETSALASPTQRVVLQATAHTVRLVFSDLDVLPAPLGYRPFEVKD
jgi:hypothetical protein